MEQVDYVYVIGMDTKVAPFRNYRKIGRSWWVDQRLRELQTGSPIKMKVFQTFKFTGVYGALAFEQACHKHFTTRRLEGEWFDIHEIEVEGFYGDFLQSIQDKAEDRFSREAARERAMQETRDNARRVIKDRLLGPVERARMQETLAELGL